MGLELIGIGNVLTSLEELQDRMSPAAWKVGTHTEYAPYVELGTSNQPAQPHLRPGARRAIAKADEFAKKADSMAELIKMIALEAEKQTKKRAPVDTGQLMNSYTAAEVEAFQDAAENALSEAKT